MLEPQTGRNRTGLRNKALRAAFTTLAATMLLSSSALAQVGTGRPQQPTRNAPALTAGQLTFHTLGTGGVQNPKSNRELSDATYAACNQAPNGSTCVSSTLAAINSARASEGVGPMTLPAGFSSLTVPQQLMVLANLERVGRGLTPVAGLAGSLNAIAAHAAAADQDPMPSHYNGDVVTSNWAGGTASTLVADFLWMYDDAPGSYNTACQHPGEWGCWGHRDNILYRFDNPIAMGAGFAASTGDGASLAELFVGGETAIGPGQADALVAPTWATLAHSLMVGLSTTSIQLVGGEQTAQLQLSSPDRSMNVGATVTSGGGAWHVSQPDCSLTAGSTCQLTVTVSSAGLGSSGTLTVTGPGGPQTVSLASQATGTLRIRVNQDPGQARRHSSRSAAGCSARPARARPVRRWLCSASAGKRSGRSPPPAAAQPARSTSGWRRARTRPTGSRSRAHRRSPPRARGPSRSASPIGSAPTPRASGVIVAATAR